jgi:hypothetical protein
MAARRWYLFGSLLWLLTGIAHGVGQFVAGTDAPYRSVTAVMKGYAIVPGRFTLFDFMQEMGVWVSVLCAFVAVVGFVTARVSGEDPPVLRALALVNVFGGAALSAISFAYGFPPPAIFFLLIALSFALSWWSAPRAEA